MAEVQDNNLNRTAKTFYDLANRPSQNVLRENGNMIYSTRLLYDKQNNLKQFAETAEGVTHTTDYSYDRDNRVTEIGFDSSAEKVKYTFDALGRATTRKVEGTNSAGDITSSYEYVSGGYGTNSTSLLVSKITQPQIPFEYAYDNIGNIISEKRANQTSTFAYDALGQLIRVNDPSKNETWVYTYDRGGNILSKKRYAYTIGALGAVLETIPYVYGDNNWKDKLTSFNGVSLSYDGYGNLTNDGARQYQWQAGWQLRRMSAEGTAVSFKYDHNSLRVQKKVETDWYPVTTHYCWNGTMLTHMKVNYTDMDENSQQDDLHFFYGANFKPAKVLFNGVMYTYMYDLLDSVVGILDNGGRLVVEYKYDPWGKILSITGSLASTLGTRNPFRYRGYVYDDETGLYYLKKRYYDPEMQRFISADQVVGQVGSLLTGNVYAYCRNSPICFSDEGGNWSLLKTLAAVAVAAVAVVATCAVLAAAAPAAICTLTLGFTYYGAGYAAATLAAEAVVYTGILIAEAAAYDVAYEAVTGTKISDEALGEGASDALRFGGSIATAGILGAAASSPGVCFIAGTSVSTEKGLVPIEDIQPGQYVWAENPETGEIALKQVVQTFVNETNELVHVQVNGETITCTTEHPFYVHGTGWVAAKDLKIGDKLELQNSKNAFVDAVLREKLAKPIHVFNFEVAEFHTYYVGVGCVLVHNKCNKSQAKKVTPQAVEKQYGFKDGSFHRVIKPALLQAVPPNFSVGRNPDIMMDRAGYIAYQSTKGTGFQDTFLNIKDVIERWVR